MKHLKSLFKTTSTPWSGTILGAFVLLVMLELPFTAFMVLIVGGLLDGIGQAWAEDTDSE